jgi:hypothetical protein
LYAILAVVIFLIAYGSLFPWKFSPHELPANPLWILLHAWQTNFDRRFFADIAVNVALYFPLGMSGVLALRRFRVAGTIAIGTVLSASIEMAQLYTPNRNTSAFDLVDNILGTILGALVGLVFEGVLKSQNWRHRTRKPPDRTAIALVFCWVGALTFPLFPVTRLAGYRENAAYFLNASFDAMAVLTAFAWWMAAGGLLKASRLPRPQALLWLSVSLAPLQFFIINRHATPWDVAGAVAGVIFFLIAGKRRVAAAVFLACLAVHSLYPFRFGAAQEIYWAPFGGFLNMDWETGVRVLLEKVFWYATAIWFLRSRYATPIVFGLLSAIEVLQVWMPGHVAETTDPLLALLAGFGVWTLNRQRSKSDAELPQPARR